MQRFRSYRNIKAFTLAEIIVVLVIVGVMASLAVPKFTSTFERVRAAEGVQMLTALLGAQKSYEFEFGAYSTNAAVLDVDITAAAYFNVPPAVDSSDPIASITRTPNQYTLNIDADGTISCAPGAGPFTCGQAGY